MLKKTILRIIAFALVLAMLASFAVACNKDTSNSGNNDQQGDVNTEYVEPEEPTENEANNTLSKILDIIFRILRVLLSIFGLYIAPEL